MDAEPLFKDRRDGSTEPGGQPRRLALASMYGHLYAADVAHAQGNPRLAQQHRNTAEDHLFGRTAQSAVA